MVWVALFKGGKALVEILVAGPREFGGLHIFLLQIARTLTSTAQHSLLRCWGLDNRAG